LTEQKLACRRGLRGYEMPAMQCAYGDKEHSEQPERHHSQTPGLF
jgi:hypothetical protein